MSWLSRLFGSRSTDITIIVGDQAAKKLVTLQMLLGNSNPGETVGDALSVLEAIVQAYRNGYTKFSASDDKGNVMVLDLRKLFP